MCEMDFGMLLTQWLARMVRKVKVSGSNPQEDKDAFCVFFCFFCFAFAFFPFFYSSFPCAITIKHKKIAYTLLFVFFHTYSLILSLSPSKPPPADIFWFDRTRAVSDARVSESLLRRCSLAQPFSHFGFWCTSKNGKPIYHWPSGHGTLGPSTPGRAAALN
jgi:hypothetical protein